MDGLDMTGGLAGLSSSLSSGLEDASEDMGDDDCSLHVLPPSEDECISTSLSESSVVSGTSGGN
jgi:hypothetical protein